MENDHKILAFILTGEEHFIDNIYKKWICVSRNPKPKPIKKLSRRQKRARDYGDGLGKEKENFKYTKVRSYSHKIEEIGKIHGGYVAYNKGEDEYIPKQSPCNNSNATVRNVGPQPLRHFGL
jgi:hypothetical protein